MRDRGMVRCNGVLVSACTCRPTVRDEFILVRGSRLQFTIPTVDVIDDLKVEDPSHGRRQDAKDMLDSIHIIPPSSLREPAGHFRFAKSNKVGPGLTLDTA